MTEMQADVLLHALGLDRAQKSFRNFYVSGPGCRDFISVQHLAAMGYMTRGKRSPSWDGIQELHYYEVTAAGIIEADRVKAARSARVS